MKTIILTSLFSLFSFYAFAGGGSQGHGGDGWLDDNGKPWLYDFKEGNIHKNPYFDNGVVRDHELESRISQKIPFLAYETKVLLAKKIKEVSRIYPAFGQAMILGIEVYTWIDSDKLLNIRDEDPILDIPKDRQVQLAARVNKSIYIDQEFFNQMDVRNQVGLIFHEMVYAWMTPMAQEKDDYSLYYKQESVKAREIVRFFFSKEYLSHTLTSIRDHLASYSFNSLKILTIDSFQEQQKKEERKLSLTFKVLSTRTYNYSYYPLEESIEIGVSLSSNQDQDVINYINMVEDFCGRVFKNNTLSDSKHEFFKLQLKISSSKTKVVLREFKTESGKVSYFLDDVSEVAIEKQSNFTQKYDFEPKYGPNNCHKAAVNLLSGIIF